MEQQHYVCTGDCGGVSPEPGMCQAMECSQHGEPLVSCDCREDAHIVATGRDEDIEEA